MRRSFLSKLLLRTMVVLEPTARVQAALEWAGQVWLDELVRKRRDSAVRPAARAMWATAAVACRLGENVVSVLEGCGLVLAGVVFVCVVGVGWAATEIRQTWGL